MYRPGNSVIMMSSSLEYRSFSVCITYTSKGGMGGGGQRLGGRCSGWGPGADQNSKTMMLSGLESRSFSVCITYEAREAAGGVQLVGCRYERWGSKPPTDYVMMM